MASLFAKRVASNLLRVRPVASCSRFFGTKGYQYVQHDNEGECILKCDGIHGSSFIRGVVNDAFNPYFTPIGNLAHLLHVADELVGFQYKTHVLPRWNVVENDKAFYLIRNMPATYGRYVKDYVPKENVMSGTSAKDVKELVPQQETNQERDLSPIVSLMRGIKFGPSSEYYYGVMQDAEEVDSLVKSVMESKIGGTIHLKVRVSLYRVVHHPHPQAVYIIVGFGTPGAGSPYGGYAYEMLVEDGSYNIFDVLTDLSSEIWKVTIPKKKGEKIQTIGGNLIFFREKKV